MSSKSLRLGTGISIGSCGLPLLSLPFGVDFWDLGCSAMSGQSSEQVASLKGPRLKLDRAKSHLDDLVEAIKRFYETNPYDGVVKDNPETQRREFTVTRADPLPDDLAVICGDAVHNLRSALDHLIWQLIIANGGEPDEKAAFPIWRSESKFKSGRPGHAKGVSKQALDLLYGLQPYKGGNDALWRIHQLDIVDKHRLLLTVAMRHESVILDLGGMANRLLGSDVEWDPMPIALNPAERQIIKVGTVLFASPLGDEAHDDVKANFEVALREPEIPIYESLTKALHELFSFAGEVIDLFSPLIEGQPASS
jgi:hypothetical protein